MSLSLLVFMGIPFFCAMGWTHAQFQQLHGLEKAVIALDNASILLGRSERDLFDRISKANTHLHRLDQVHHIWHACAKNPTTAVKCQPVDLAWEAKLHAIHAAALIQAREGWERGLAIAAKAALELGNTVMVHRPPEPPLLPVRCPQCGVLILWRREESRSMLAVSWKGRRFVNEERVLESSLQTRVKWKYQIREVEGG